MVPEALAHGLAEFNRRTSTCQSALAVHVPSDTISVSANCHFGWNGPISGLYPSGNGAPCPFCITWLRPPSLPSAPLTLSFPEIATLGVEQRKEKY